VSDLLAADVVALLGARGLRLATAESLTGGGVGARVTDVPGASAVYVGGVVSYATRVKVELLGVPSSVVDEHGVVSAGCARAMAEGVRTLLGADVGVATTGVAGPDPQEGRPVGTVFVAVADARGVAVAEHRFAGDRAAVRAATVGAVLRLLLDRISTKP
jgi:nicotinamide-nucleotide amidase